VPHSLIPTSPTAAFLWRIISDYGSRLAIHPACVKTDGKHFGAMGDDWLLDA